MNWFISILSLIVAVVLIYFVVQGAIFVGWAVGGVIGVILALLLVFKVLDVGWFFGLIALIIIVNLIFNFL